MKIKLRDEPTFLAAALCLFFPVGLFLLIFSNLPFKRKALFGIAGGMIFLLLLSLALLFPNKQAETKDFQVSVTRETLSVGQSGGFLITNGNDYFTEFTVKSNGDCLEIQNNLYTAVKPGICDLKIYFAEECRTVTIQVTNGQGTDSPVLASPTGERYHKPTASHAGKRAVEITEEDALQSGKTPCKTCYK